MKTEKFPDLRTSTVNIITGTQALSRLAAMLNFTAIQGDQREAVCELFDSLQTVHTAIADVAGTLVTLGRTLDPNQFQFLLKHSVCPLVQLQVPAHLCHPGELKFAKEHLMDDELCEQCGVHSTTQTPSPKSRPSASKTPHKSIGQCHSLPVKKTHVHQVCHISDRCCRPLSDREVEILHKYYRVRIRSRQKADQSRENQNSRNNRQQRQRKNTDTWTGRTPTNCQD